MFHSIEIPFDSKMLFNVVKLKEGYTIDQAELAMGEMCNVVKNTYRDAGGFIAGQVFKSAGFVSEEGTIGLFSSEAAPCLSTDHIAIITYWKSFEQHETSHADEAFKEKFDVLSNMCVDTFELGYDMLWQGAPE